MSVLKQYQQGYGLGNSTYISDTAAHTSQKYQLLYCVESTVIAAITAPSLSNASALVGKTLPAGFQLTTYVTAITLTSGSLIAYDLV